MAANKLSGAAVVGHSMGGLVGLMLAKSHPGDVAKLMVGDALPYIGDIIAHGETGAQIAPQAKAISDGQVARNPTTYAEQGNATAAGVAITPDRKGAGPDKRGSDRVKSR